MNDRPSQLNPFVAMAIMSGMAFGDNPAPLPESFISKPQTEEQKQVMLKKAQEKRERRMLKSRTEPKL